MKKVAIRCVFLALFLLFLPLRAGAEEYIAAPTLDGEAGEQYKSFVESIPPEVREYLPDEMLSKDLAGAEQALREGGGVRAVFAAVGKLTGISLLQSLSLLAQIVGVLLLCAVLQSLLPKDAKSGVGKAYAFCSTLALLLLLLKRQDSSFRSLATFFATVQALSVALLPLMGTLYAMGGNVRAAVLNHGVMSAFLAVLETFCSGTVVGIAGICLALALLDAVASGINLKPLAGLIKRSYTLLVSFLMLLLCGVLGVQSTLAKAGDTLALRTARFAAGSFLPVVGGSVGESLRTVAGSVEYLRGVVGTGAVFHSTSLLSEGAFHPASLFAWGSHRQNACLRGTGKAAV